MNDFPYDVIILLGGAVNQDGSLPDSTRARVEAAADLYKAGEAQAIIACGSHGYKSLHKPEHSEAYAYAAYLKSLGIPQDKIHQETESQETLGNILFTKMRILMQHDWHRLLVIPTSSHSTGRITYLLQKILGGQYTWKIVHLNANTDPANLERETKSLQLTKEINDQYQDGDHQAIYRGLIESHPAYGGTKWTIDELRKELEAK